MQLNTYGLDGENEEVGLEKVQQLAKIWSIQLADSAVQLTAQHFKTSHNEFRIIRNTTYSRIYHLLRARPVIARVQVTSSFLFYENGIYNDMNTDQDQEAEYQYVIIIGCGHDEQFGYYLIGKNFFTESWGVNGYFYLSATKNCLGVLDEIMVCKPYKSSCFHILLMFVALPALWLLNRLSVSELPYYVSHLFIFFIKCYHQAIIFNPHSKSLLSLFRRNTISYTIIPLSFLMLLSLLSAHNFYFEDRKFMLDGEEIQMLGGEMHPSRIPYQYWDHRIRMAKAMGLNTISIYVFWNQHEVQKGVFDFESPQNNMTNFIKQCQENDMYVIIRPGPFVCGEFDYGGIPTYFLEKQKLYLRTGADPEYVNGYRSYIKAFAKSIKDLMVYNNGPILMVAIENEYTIYYPQDRAYLEDIRNAWIQNGITGPFFTSDNSWVLNSLCHLDGTAIGLNGESVRDPEFQLAYDLDPTVPAFATEVYPGWFRHWNESSDWTPVDIRDEIASYIPTKRSFNMYVVHGGTSFGLNAGSNLMNGFLSPDLTSYDYGSPISESGLPGRYYTDYREILQQAHNESLIPIPDPIPTMQIPNIKFQRVASIFDQKLITEEPSVRPLHFEYYGQNQGLGVYSTTLPVGKSGKLVFQNIHDYAHIYLNGRFVTGYSRTNSTSLTFNLPEIEAPGKLEVFCEAFGHYNVDVQMLTEWKGVFDHVWFNNELISYWTLNRLPLLDLGDNIVEKDTKNFMKGGIFKATLQLTEAKDTYLDFTSYTKGYICQWAQFRTILECRPSIQAFLPWCLAKCRIEHYLCPGC